MPSRRTAASYCALLGLMVAAVICGAERAAASIQVFINEIHYDNAGTDADEFVEIAGPAGTSLSGWDLLLYNGANGDVYATIVLSGVIDNEMNGFGALGFVTPGIQNGSPDGIALVDAADNVIQFLSYEGSMTADDGLASGMTSEDIGVDQDPAPAAGMTLQLVGTGNEYSDFTWVDPPASSGVINIDQTFTPLNGVVPEPVSVVVWVGLAMACGGFAKTRKRS